MSIASFASFKIPAMPQIAREALNYFYKSEPDVGVIARIVHSDVSLTATILRLGNSARFNNAGPSTSDLKVAIGRIGLNALRQILVTHAFSEALKVGPDCPINCNVFWRHSAMTAEIAYELAQKSNRATAADLQLAGVLHDIGFLLFALNLPQECKNVLDKAISTKNDFHTVEKNLGMMPHHSISALVVKEWNIPQTVQILVENHDVDDEATLSKFSAEIRTHIDILQLADMLSHWFGGTYEGYHRDVRIDQKVLTKAGLSSDDVARAVKNAKSFLEVFIPA